MAITRIPDKQKRKSVKDSAIIRTIDRELLSLDDLGAFDYRSDTLNQKKLMLEAMVKSMGVVSMACDSVRIHWSTHKRWLEKDKIYADACEAIQERAVDFVEHKLFKRISEGDTTAITFFLRTRGRKRGYGEKLEIANTNPITGNEPIIFE